MPRHHTTPPHEDPAAISATLAASRISDRAFEGARNWLQLARDVRRRYGQGAAIVTKYAQQARHANRLGLEARREGR